MFFLAPGSELLKRLVLGRGVEADDRFARFDLFGNEVLESGHLKGLLSDLFGQVCRDHDDTVVIADNDITRKDGDITAADRDIQVESLVAGRLRR